MSTSVQKAADTAAAVSVPAWLVSLAAEALPVVQLIAGVIAIVAGGFAIAVHWKKLKERK